MSKVEVIVFTKKDIQDTFIRIGIVASYKFQSNGVMPASLINDFSIDSIGKSFEKGDIHYAQWVCGSIGRKILNDSFMAYNQDNRNVICLHEEERKYLGEALMKIGSGEDANVAFKLKTLIKTRGRSTKLRDARITLEFLWFMYLTAHYTVTPSKNGGGTISEIMAKNKRYKSSQGKALSPKQIADIYDKNKEKLKQELADMGLSAICTSLKRNDNDCCHNIPLALWDDNNALLGHAPHP